VRALMILAIGAACVAGCTTHPRSSGRPVVTAERDPAAPRWTTIATPGDRARLETLTDSWTRARAAVPKRLVRRLREEGALLDPAAALDLPALSPGSYRCRLVRLGGRAGYASFAPDFCYVDGDGAGLSFTKQTGTTLPGGWLHPDTDRRQVFLGTVRTAAAEVAPPYGTTPARDIAGVVERVGPLRWRLVMTRAGQGAILDLYELVPVPPAPPATPR